MPKLFLLQAQASVNWDLGSTQPKTAAILVGGLIILVGMLLFFIARYVRKLGPLDMKKERGIQTFQYNMNREKDEQDDQMRMRIRSVTRSLKTRLINIFSEYKMCPITVIALSHAVPGPLYTSASNNHFTTVLLPERRDAYLADLLRAVEDEYMATYNSMPTVNCVNDGKMPAWDEIKDRIQKFLYEWADGVVTEVIKTSMRKIDIYKKYEPDFKSDSDMSAMVASCIAKNEKYISLLDRHGQGSRY